MFRALKLTVLVVVMFAATPAMAGSELAKIEVRPDVPMKAMIVESSAEAKAVLVLYPGGVGTLSLGSIFGKPTIGNYANNFLVRVRDEFVDKGYVVVLPDVPSDRPKADYKYRLSDEQIADAKSTVSYLKGRYNLPVWLVGTSASSLSVAHSASALADQIAGIILTASVTQVPSDYAVYSDFPKGTASTNLSSLKIPVLIISNSEDACNQSPSAGSELIKAKLTNSPRAVIKYVSGGDNPRSGPCEALSRHGFLGIENEVVDEMVNFDKRGELNTIEPQSTPSTRWPAISYMLGREAERFLLAQLRSTS